MRLWTSKHGPSKRARLFFNVTNRLENKPMTEKHAAGLRTAVIEAGRSGSAFAFQLACARSDKMTVVLRSDSDRWQTLQRELAVSLVGAALIAMASGALHQAFSVLMQLTDDQFLQSMNNFFAVFWRTHRSLHLQHKLFDERVIDWVVTCCFETFRRISARERSVGTRKQWASELAGRRRASPPA